MALSIAKKVNLAQPSPPLQLARWSLSGLSDSRKKETAYE
jgi:hypothetical protein